MRILHVCHLFSAELEGGVQSYVSGLLDHQRAAGHEVCVLSGSLSYDGPATVDEGGCDGVPVTTIHRAPEERWSADLGSERIGAVVEKALAAFRPDVCHVHHWQGLTNDIVRRAVAYGARVVVTLHDLFTTCPLFFRMRVDTESCPSELPLGECAKCLLGGLGGVGAVELKALLAERHEQLQQELDAASAVTTMSAYMRDRLSAVPYFRRQAIQVLPIGVMHDELESVDPPAPEPGRLRIANWAGIAPRKGLHVLLEALAGSAHASAFEVHVHGHEDNREYVRDLRRLQGDVDVRWRGPFTGATSLLEVAATCDLAVFPSLEEPYGLAQDEAMLLGMPVVVADQGAPPERVGGRGIVVPVDDPKALRAVLERLLVAPEELGGLREGPCGARRIREHLPELMDLYGRLLNA
ncbi:MAG: glycosyltransferase [Planctomycetes bacterium]|nr:glycosyltransferase [Planctomycetota bacterium]